MGNKIVSRNRISDQWSAINQASRFHHIFEVIDTITFHQESCPGGNDQTGDDDSFIYVDVNSKLAKTCLFTQSPLIICPLTILKLLPEFTTHSAMTELESADFNFTNHWEDLGRRLKVKFNDRSMFRRDIQIDGDCKRALEQCLDIWKHNQLNASWIELISAVDVYEHSTAEKLRKNLGLYCPDTLTKLQMPCDEGILTKLNVLLKISEYKNLVPYFLSDYEKTMVDKESADDQQILRMLYHWKDCRRGHSATYEALVCIFKSAISEPHAVNPIIDMIISHVESPSISMAMEEDTLKTVNCLSPSELRALKEEFQSIHRSFAKVLSCGLTSLSISTKNNFIEVKLYLSTRCGNHAEKYNKAQNSEELVLIVSQSVDWFNFKLYEELISMFGTEEHQIKLKEYKTSLLNFLNRSVLDLPRTVCEHESISKSSSKKVVLKIPDTNSEPPIVYGGDVQFIQEKLGEHIGIQGENLKLCEYRRGCVELVFSIDAHELSALENIEWSDEYQEYRIKADSLSLMPDTFFQRNMQLIN